MTNRQLLKQIHKYNPKWENAIRAYLKEQIEYLNSSVDTDQLDINVLDMCIVGEVYHFSNAYDNEASKYKCEQCDMFGMQLWSNGGNSWDHRETFENILKSFYNHVETMHPKIQEYHIGNTSRRNV